MIHLCFIVDNSLTMDQRPNRGLSLLDGVKSSIETTLRSLSRIGFPNNHEHIHLFCTSRPRSPLSSFEHDESHLFCQLKSITSALETDPSLTIQCALDHISKFRILSQAETLKGYREAYLYEPSLLFFFSDRMTRAKIERIVVSVEEGRLQMRSEYQLTAYLVCSPSQSEKTVITEQVFRSSVQNQREIKRYTEAVHAINGEVVLAINEASLSSLLWSRIEGFKPFLFFHFELREIKRKCGEFAVSQRGQAYFTAWQQYLSNIPFQLRPTQICKIPLPFATKCVEQAGEWRVERLGKLRFFLDLTKRYTEVNSVLMPVSKYRINLNPAIDMLEKEQLEERYPIFVDNKGVECLVGLFCVSPGNSEVQFFFGNFPVLNGVFKAIEAKQSQKMIESSIYPYIAALPYFYVKFLRGIFDKLGLDLNYDIFENPLAGSGVLALQGRLEGVRLQQKKNLGKLFQSNLQAHQNNRSDCCPIYSSNYDIYCQQISSQGTGYDEVQHYCSDLLGDILAFKRRVGIEDYLTAGLIESVPVMRELEKYSAVKKGGDDDFNENITVNFGNPYKKKRKVNSDSDVAVVSKENSVVTQVPATKKQIQKIVEETVIVREAKNAMIDERDETKSRLKREKQIQKQQNMPKQTKEPRDPRDPRSREPKKTVAVDQDAKRTNVSQVTSVISQSVPICETIRLINSLPIQKGVFVSFNPKNLATPKMLHNQKLMQGVLSKHKKK